MALPSTNTSSTDTQICLLDKKYIFSGSSFIKRTLRPHERRVDPNTGTICNPSHCWPQRWTTDGACLQYIAVSTSIPVPHFQFALEDDGAFYFSTELVPDVVPMSALCADDRDDVAKELVQYMVQLNELKSERPGVPGHELLCPPIRVHKDGWNENCCFRLKDTFEPKGTYVFCHNDLRPQNVLVDMATFRIAAIIDWEYAGFWPAWFEAAFWKRDQHERECDVQMLRGWLEENCDVVPMPPIG